LISLLSNLRAHPSQARRASVCASGKCVELLREGDSAVVTSNGASIDIRSQPASWSFSVLKNKFMRRSGCGRQSTRMFRRDAVLGVRGPMRLRPKTCGYSPPPLLADHPTPAGPGTPPVGCAGPAPVEQGAGPESTGTTHHEVSLTLWKYAPCEQGWIKKWNTKSRAERCGYAAPGTCRRPRFKDAVLYEAGGGSDCAGRFANVNIRDAAVPPRFAAEFRYYFWIHWRGSGLCHRTR
jgi:hypothetical protein